MWVWDTVSIGISISASASMAQGSRHMTIGQLEGAHYMLDASLTASCGVKNHVDALITHANGPWGAPMAVGPMHHSMVWSDFPLSPAPCPSYPTHLPLALSPSLPLSPITCLPLTCHLPATHTHTHPLSLSCRPFACHSLAPLAIYSLATSQTTCLPHTSH